MSYLRTTPAPGGRRDRRLRSGSRTRMTRQLGVSAAIVAFAFGSFSSAAADSFQAATLDARTVASEVVAPVGAAAPETQIVTETEEVTLPHGEVTTSDPGALTGSTVVVTEGAPGKALVSYEVTYVDGVEVSRVETVSVVVDQPVDKVTKVGSLVIPPTTEAQKGTNRALGQQMAAARGWTGDQWACLDNLWARESGWSHTAENRSSGAYGIPQALPGSKMAVYGDDWRTNPATQIEWGLAYVGGRYGTPCGAWSHFLTKNWY